MGAVEQRLVARAALAGLALPEALRKRLAVYYDLLLRWNRTINLTGMPDSDEAVDRLLLEPVAAASHLAHGSSLMDLGSGGGSPAIPLALALGCPTLVMVETRERKAAFLREAVRTLGLGGTVVVAQFESLRERSDYIGAMDIVSIRGVKMTARALDAAGQLVRLDGTLALFISANTPLTTPAHFTSSRHPLGVGNAELMVCRRHVPRGTSPS